ncbi:DoxX family protein [Salmonirosea aquatica]|uniref:DoxX family protein n=1 Tax=Salmonirosea aquatica TaxID=2654236 RepID=A0A7C9FCR4_9BACT|nr:DoxX family protein [Cytophagaceae bacterium SJW1-29]
MKKDKIIYWAATLFIFLFEGVMPALTSQTELAKEGIRHLGYPDYFGNILVVFKVLGSLALVIPQVRGRVKEWVYAGFVFDFLFATISLIVVDGPIPQSFFPMVILAILGVSYIYYHKLNHPLSARA